MSKTNVEIRFKIDGLDAYIDDLETLDSVLKQVKDTTKDVSKETDDIGKSKGKLSGFFSAVKGKGVAAFKALKGAIAATGIGLLLTGLAQLVEWFKESDTGAKILQATTSALGVIFDRIVKLVTPLGEKISSIFSDPKQAMIDFANAFKQNITDKFNALIDGLGLAASAVKKFFSGDFTGAAEDAKQSANKLLVEATLLGDVIDGVTTVVEEVSVAFEGVTDEINNVITASNNLIDAQNNLRKTQRDLLVENAQLTQDLETQKKISEDTTRSYDERKEALDKVNEANEQLADNAVRLAKEEEAVLQQKLRLAKTDEERREIEDALAEATATRIDAETQAEIVRLESAQLSRELDMEEKDRKQSIYDLTNELRNKTITDEREAAREALRLAEEQTLKELEALKGTEEEKEAVREYYRKLKADQDDKYRKEDEEKDKADAKKKQELEEKVKDAKIDIAIQALGAISALQEAFSSDNEENAERNFKIQKALSLAQATISGVEGVQNAFTTAQASPITTLFPAYPFIQAGLAGAFAAAQIATIAKSSFQNPGKPDSDVGGGGGGVNPIAALPTPQTTNGQSITAGGVQSSSQQSQPVRAYVISTEVDSALQANQQIENLSRL